MTRHTLTVIALVLGAQVAFAQGAPGTKAPATKAPATQEQPSFFTRMKRLVGLEKAPAVTPAAAPAAKPDSAKGATKQDTKAPGTKGTATKAPATKTPVTKTPTTKAPVDTKQGTKAQADARATPQGEQGKTGAKAPAAGTKAPATKQAALTVAPETAPLVKAPVIMREVFDYTSEGRRDPFFSLLTTSELRPALVDLRLTGLIYDPSGRRSVAIMRDVKDNTQYRVTTGMQLGRMRVALIKPRSVIFSIEEFGLNRQDSLVLGDTTKVRAK